MDPSDYGEVGVVAGVTTAAGMIVRWLWKTVSVRPKLDAMASEMVSARAEIIERLEELEKFDARADERLKSVEETIRRVNWFKD